MSRPLSRQFHLKLPQVPWPAVLLVTLLSALGTAMMYSAAGGSMSPWAKAQSIRYVLGGVLMLTLAVLPPRTLYRYAYHALGLCFVLLVVVEVVGHIGMGAQRWVSVGGLNLQPSEFTKVALIVALARYFHGVAQIDVSRPVILLPAVAMIVVPAVLILIQPNLGTTTTYVTVGVSLLWAAGASWKYFAAAAAALAAAAPLAWQFLLHDYQKRRVFTFLSPEDDPLGAGYNIMQSKIAIGSAGLFGKGFLQGSQSQLSFLPEKQTDFIFTMIAEELGFVGAASVLGVYTLLLLYAYGIAIRARHQFGRLIATGVATMLFVHLFINCAMVMGLIPVVGVPLPLLSYGGSITLAMLLALGLLFNVYVHRDDPFRPSSGGVF